MKLRHFAFFIILVVLGILVLQNIGKLGELINLLKNVNIAILLLIIPVRYLYYWSNSRYYVHFYRLFNRRLQFKKVYPAVVSMNFVNTVIPSGGISGGTFFANALEEKVTSRESFLAQAFWYLASFIGLVTVLASSFIILFFSNSILRVSYRFILIFISILLAVSFLVFAISLNETIMQKVLYISTRPINWLLKLIKRPAIGEVHIERFVSGYHDLIELFQASPRRAVQPFLDALICILVEVLSIMVVFLAFGVVINPGVAAAGYIFAMMFSLLSIFTNGVGAYEATMVAVFVALGQPLELSISVTAVYRLIAMWLFIPYGLWFYKQQMLDSDDDKKVELKHGK
ncbi:MAG: lysylphosphatidylglycerol synthase transmembrane domain-containing protein [bacterium]